LPVLSVVLALAGCAYAQQNPPLVRPGNWEVRSGSPGGAMAGYQLCLTTGGMEDVKLLLPRLQGGAVCPVDRLLRDGQAITWELSSPAIPLTASARYVLQPQSIEGKLDMVSGAPPLPRQETLSAHYGGPCTPR
jgi:hypothetical protein